MGPSLPSGEKSLSHDRTIGGGQNGYSFGVCRTVCGTPNYIAPEVLDGGKHGHSFEVDVWSLGVILYTLLVGRPPFETNDIKTTYRKIRNTSYSFPEGLEISSTAKRLIQRILQSNPGLAWMA